MSMSREDAKKYIQNHLIEYLVMVEGVDADERGKVKFRCLNPVHNDAHPSASVHMDKDGVLRCHCFSCPSEKKSYDVFDLIGWRFNLPNFNDQFKKGCELLSLDVAPYRGNTNTSNTDNTSRHDTRSGTKRDQLPPTAKESSLQEKKPEKDLTAYFKKCHQALVASGYAYTRKRGLSDKLVNYCKLGLDEHCRYGMGGKEWQALIIPTSKSTYTARNINDCDKGDRVRKYGNSVLYMQGALRTAEKPIFIVEGEIDALSVYEVGGIAVGLGSAANVGALVRVLKAMKPEKPAQPLVIALDNDTEGQSAAKQLAAALYEENIPYFFKEFNPYGKSKDANEALLTNKEEFKANVNLAVLMQQEAFEKEKEQYQQTNSVAAHMKEFINGIAESVNTPFIPTGFYDLDKALDGGLYEGLYTVGAVSSLGKTTLMQQMTDQIAAAGHDVLIFSLEMARSELMAKSISRQTMLDVVANAGNIHDAKSTRGITTGSKYQSYSQREKDLIKRAIDAYSQFANHIYIYEGLGDIGVEQVRKHVEEHISFTGNHPVVLIDYLQILAPVDVRATDKQNTDKAVLELKRISRDYKIPVLAISSFNRLNYNAAVSMEAFKESGAIEYSSDVLFALQFKGAGAGKGKFDVKAARDKNPREIELYILKNRNGRTPQNPIDFLYYPVFNYFKESAIVPDSEIPNNFTSVYDDSDGGKE